VFSVLPSALNAHLLWMELQRKPAETSQASVQPEHGLTAANSQQAIPSLDTFRFSRCYCIPNRKSYYKQSLVIVEFF
jgi:hypothetical protein